MKYAYGKLENITIQEVCNLMEDYKNGDNKILYRVSSFIGYNDTYSYDKVFKGMLKDTETYKILSFKGFQIAVDVKEYTKHESTNTIASSVKFSSCFYVIIHKDEKALHK